MAGDGWTRMPLGNFVTLQRGHDLPDERRRPGSVPILGSFGITGWHNEAKARGPGVTVGRSGASFGVVSYSPVDFWPLNTALYVVDFHGKKDFHAIPAIVAPRELVLAFERIASPLDDRIERNERESRTLAELRETLLPKLLSGELRAPSGT